MGQAPHNNKMSGLYVEFPCFPRLYTGFIRVLHNIASRYECVSKSLVSKWMNGGRACVRAPCDGLPANAYSRLSPNARSLKQHSMRFSLKKITLWNTFGIKHMQRMWLLLLNRNLLSEGQLVASWLRRMSRTRKVGGSSPSVAAIRSARLLGPWALN